MSISLRGDVEHDRCGGIDRIGVNAGGHGNSDIVIERRLNIEWQSFRFIAHEDGRPATRPNHLRNGRSTGGGCADEGDAMAL